MGMSSYVMDMEDKFMDKCADVAIDSESFQEYSTRVKAYLNMVPHLDNHELSYIIDNVWFDMHAQCGGN